MSFSRRPGLLGRPAARAALCAALALGVITPPSCPEVWAAPDKDAKKKAAAKFKEGEALFQKHSYPEAAQAFEEAYSIAPHPSGLLNAINAWTMAGQLVRSATLAQKLIADSATDDASRTEARSKLADLQTKIGRLNIRGASQIKDLTIDGKPATPGEVFVEPGDHLIEADLEGKKTRRKVTVVAGSSEQILLEAPAAAPTTAPTATAPTATATPTATEAPRSKGLPPVVVYVGGGLTLALTGVSIWSGLDTVKAREAYDSDFKQGKASEADKEAGLAKQTRTNVLIGATVVTGAVTLGIALFATNWGKGDQTASLRVGPRSISLEGTF